ncbi:MAG: hypothetical protein QM773_15260 [Hyphomonadaceae bacterium]
MRIALIAMLALGSLAACDDQAPPAAVETPGATAADAALESAAERECAQLTGYAPEKLASETPEMRALVEREYKSCVAKVTGPP